MATINKVFFGRIAKNRNKQLENCYYESPKGAVHFHDLKIGDVVYMIAESKIRLWKADRWGINEDGKECLYFEEKISEIQFGAGPMATRHFRALKILKASVDLLVLTSRIRKNKAFFQVELTSPIDENILFEESYYEDEENYRKVIVHSDESGLDHENQSDFQFYYENSKLNVFESNFYSKRVYSQFRDNLRLRGNGRRRKDSTMSKFLLGEKVMKEYSCIELDMMHVYDAFFVDYGENEKSFWAFHCNPSVWDIERYLADKDTFMWKLNKGHVDEIKKGDDFLLWVSGESAGVYAIGKVISKPKKMMPDENENSLYSKNGGEDSIELRVKLKVDENIQGNPILKNQVLLEMDLLEENEVFTFFNNPQGVTSKRLNEDVFNYITSLKNDPPDNDYLYPSLNTILYGPPGTGKTYNTIKMAAEIVEGKTIENYKEAQLKFNEGLSNEQIRFVTFHQNYSYEDFIEGLRPETSNNTDGSLKFHRKPGVFKEIVDKAKEDINQKYVIVIDEINRANISRVFGELITLIEEDKRSDGATPLSAVLPSGASFEVPSNLFIIGTMNTADKSIALLDIALRRRFEFVGMYPLYDGDERLKGAKIHESKFLKKLNKKIIGEEKPDFQIGHSYFMNNGDFDFLKVMNNKVIPLLMEYFMNNKIFIVGLLEKEVKKVGNYQFSNTWPLQIELSGNEDSSTNEE